MYHITGKAFTRMCMLRRLKQLGAREDNFFVFVQKKNKLGLSWAKLSQSC